MSAVIQEPLPLPLLREGRVGKTCSVDEVDDVEASVLNFDGDVVRFADVDLDSWLFPGVEEGLDFVHEELDGFVVYFLIGDLVASVFACVVLVLAGVGVFAATSAGTAGSSAVGVVDLCDVDFYWCGGCHDSCPWWWLVPCPLPVTGGGGELTYQEPLATRLSSDRVRSKTGCGFSSHVMVSVMKVTSMTGSP